MELRVDSVHLSFQSLALNKDRTEDTGRQHSDAQDADHIGDEGQQGKFL